MSRNKRWKKSVLAAALAVSASLSLMGSSLIDPAKVSDKETEYTTVQAEIGSLLKTLSSDASLQFPLMVDVRNKLYNARVAEVYLTRADIIQEGAKLGLIASESSEADLAQTQLSLERARKELAEGTKDREEAILKKQKSISSLSGNAREIARLELQKMQISLSDFKLGQERTIANLEKSIEEQTEQSIDQEVSAPITGGIAYFSYINPGDSLYYNQVLLTLASPTPYLLRIEDSAGEWRYGMEITLDYGPHNNRKSCTGRIISADNILSHESRTGYAYAILDEEINPETITMPNVKGELYHVENVLVIPKKASKIYGGDNMVSLLEGSSIANRYVNLGLSNADGSWVVQGLEEGQTLIVD